MPHEFSKQTRIYPNPNQGIFNLEAEGISGKTYITILNVVGETVFSQQVEVNGKLNLPLDMGDAPPGIYFISVRNQDKMAVKKIVKN